MKISLLTILAITSFSPSISLANHWLQEENVDIKYDWRQLSFSGFFGKDPVLMVVSERETCDQLFSRFEKVYGREALTTERLCNIIGAKFNEASGDIVLLVFQGKRPTTEGYSTNVNRVYLRGNTVVVDVNFNGPTRDQLKNRGQASSPLVILRINKENIPVVGVLDFELSVAGYSDKEAKNFVKTGVVLDNQDYSSDKLLVRFKKGTPSILVDALNKQLGTTVLKKPDPRSGSDYYIIQVSGDDDLEETLNKVKNLKEVEAASFDYLRSRSRIMLKN